MKITPQTSRRRGSILPLFALSLPVLFGMAALAVDYGTLLSDRNHLQRACDAAALAGAAYLKRSPDENSNTARAREEALIVAAQNRLAPGEMTEREINFLDNNTKIQVSASRSRPLFFAHYLGITPRRIGASATAEVSPAKAAPVPIAITTQSKARYQNDGLPHEFTLVRPQDTAFKTDYGRAPAFDPFTIFDLRGGSSSPEQMQRQLVGDLTDPVNPQIGDRLTTMRPSLRTLADKFKDGIGPRFQKAAQSPWLDPVTGLLPQTQPWQMEGTRLNDILGGVAADGNPRIVTFIVMDEVLTPLNGGDDLPIVDFATAYISSVEDTADRGVKLTMTFLPEGTSNSSGSVALID